MEKILIVVDMQNDFVDEALGSKEAQAIVPHVVKKINDFDGKIIVTRDTHHENYLETREGKFLPVPHCIINTHGWEINPLVQAALVGKDVTYINKPTFGSVELVNVLDEIADVKNLEVELIGLCTDICVVSNAMLIKANYPEMNISVDANCCAGVTTDSHNAALATMKMCQIVVSE